MLLLSALCCLLLGSALAKPPPAALAGKEPKSAGDSLLIHTLNGRGRQIEPRKASGVDSGLRLLPAKADRKAYVLPTGSYYLKSPGYPDQYPNDQDIQVEISGDQGQLITVECNNVQIEYDPDCAFDFLKIAGTKYCGNIGIPPISDTRLQIEFHSDDSFRGAGFNCLLTVSGTDWTTTTTTTEAPSGDQCCGVPNRASRIVGGVQTEVNEYPWQAGLVNSGSNTPWCGGTVINNQWVMTAAHCTAGVTAGNLQVLLRKHSRDSDGDQIRVNVAQIVDHPGYNSGTMANDFSLLKLSQTLNFAALANKVAPACLPTGGDFVDVDAIVSGWGHTASGGGSPSSLHEVTVQTMSNAECIGDLGSRIDNTMLCADVDAGGKDSCQGDSGGPLVTRVSGRYYLIGVVSWGYGCANRGSPGVYARMTAVSSWIQQTTAGASLC